MPFRKLSYYPKRENNCSMSQNLLFLPGSSPEPKYLQKNNYQKQLSNKAKLPIFLIKFTTFYNTHISLAMTV